MVLLQPSSAVMKTFLLNATFGMNQPTENFGGLCRNIYISDTLASTFHREILKSMLPKLEEHYLCARIYIMDK